MPAGDMNPPAEELLEDEYLDDPITLIDYEQARLNAIWQEAENVRSQEIIPTIDLVPSEVRPTQKRNHFVLPVSFFDIPSNLRLLNYCCPLSIKVVDCDKFPWYYKKYKRNFSSPCYETIVIEDDLINNETDNSVKMDVNKITCQPIGLNGLRKRGGPLSQKILQKRLEHRKWRDDEEKNKAICQKNTSKVDFKRNTGLIGMKITRWVGQERFDNFVVKNVIEKKKKQVTSDETKVDKYLFHVDTILKNVDTSIMPITNIEETGDNALIPKENVNSGQNNKINLHGPVINRMIRKRRSNKCRKTSDEKTIIHDCKTIPDSTKYTPTKISETKTYSPKKLSDVKDKRKTNKYLNDLLKKRIKTLRIIKSLKKLKEKNKIDKSKKDVPSSTITEMKNNPHIENKSDVVIPDVKVDSGIKSPVLPCKTNICHKFTPQNSLTNFELSTLKEKLMDDINKLKEVPNSVRDDNIKSNNETNSPNPLNHDKNCTINVKAESSTQCSVKEDIVNNNINNNISSFKITKNTTNPVNSGTKELATSKAVTEIRTNLASSSYCKTAKNNNTTIQQTIPRNNIQIKYMDKNVNHTNSGTKSSNNSMKQLHNIMNNIHNVIIKSNKPINNVNNNVNNLSVNTFAVRNRNISKYIPPNQRKKKSSQSGFLIQTLVRNKPNETPTEIDLVQKAPPGFKTVIPHYHPVQPIVHPNIVTNNLVRCPNDCMLTYQHKANLSQRMPPLVNVHSKEMYMPYWYPPLPLLPPPPPPPPPRETLQSHYTTQYLPYQPPNYIDTNKNENLLTVTTVIDNKDIKSLHETKSTRPTETNFKVVGTKTEMLEELEKEMLTTNYNNDCPEDKINNISAISSNPNSQIKLLVSDPRTQNLIENSNNQKICSIKSELHVEGLTSDDAEQNCKSTLTSNITNPMKQTVNEIGNNSHNADIPNQNISNEPLLSKSSIDAHANLNKTQSLVIGTKINTYHNKMCPTKPRIGPLSKIHKHNVSQTYKTGAKELKSNGYSPPILPIPTYDSTLEMLSKLSGSQTKLFGLNVKNYDGKTLHTQFNSEIIPQRNTCSYTKAKRNDRMSNEEKAAKKISLEEYKKRSSKPEFNVGIHSEETPLSMQNKRNRKEQIPSKSVHTLSGIVNHDQDLGYDSDSTVKL